MKLNSAGVNLIKEFEACKLESYPDLKGIWTIGYGCTHNVHPGMKISDEDAISRLTQDLSVIVHAISALIEVPLNDNQLSGLVSLAYNIGIGHFSESTLLKKLNEGKIEEALAEFAVWNKVAGKECDGLVRRRKAEQALFSIPVEDAYA